MPFLRNYREDAKGYIYNNFYSSGEKQVGELKFYVGKKSMEIGMARRIAPLIVEKYFFLPRQLVHTVYSDDVLNVFVKINGKYYKVYTDKDIFDLILSYKNCIEADEFTLAENESLMKFVIYINDIKVIKFPDNYPPEIIMKFL